MKVFITSLVLAFTLPIQSWACPAHAELKFAKADLYAHMGWQGAKPDGSGTESVLRIEWRKLSTGEAAEPASFNVVLWMPSMGHGSAPTRVQRVVDTKGQAVLGAFYVRNMYFMMPGDWEVRVTAKNANGVEDTQTWAFDIGGDHHSH